jgi:transposase-like protein
MFSEMKTDERERARLMRLREGRSIKEIARLVGVATSTVSVWVRDIELTAEQHAALEQRNPVYNSQRNGWAANIERGRKRRRAHQEWGRSLARRRQAGYAAGCMLYWAEGAKARHQLRFANADPEAVAFFVAFLREHFCVADSALRLKCHLFADHEGRQEEVEQFWLDLLGLPRSALQKSYVNRYSRSSKRKRLNKLPFGTCNVIVNNTRILQAIYGSIQEYGGFERPEWLG